MNEIRSIKSKKSRRGSRTRRSARGIKKPVRAPKKFDSDNLAGLKAMKKRTMSITHEIEYESPALTLGTKSTVRYCGFLTFF